MENIKPILESAGALYGFNPSLIIVENPLIVTFIIVNQDISL
jgi:hypothetical protein